VQLPPRAAFDYQIGEAYSPSTGVRVVSRDREAEVAEGLYNICYVNGLQTQPQDNAWWEKEHPELLVSDGDGKPLLDEDWGEYLLDISSANKRNRILEIVLPWIDGCAEAGFDAVEIDNLDTYSRSNDQIEPADAVAFMSALSERAHARGLAVGQKNSAELLEFSDEMGTDFAIAEECNRWDECSEYSDAYDGLVFVIEYRSQDFDQGCKGSLDLPTVLRDLDVTAPGSKTYVYRYCGP
jgi:hypothetical protein